MSWNPDRPPIEYLERRVKFYKKGIRFQSHRTDELLLKKYGKKELDAMIERAIKNRKKRIKQFEKAIRILRADGRNIKAG